MIKIISKWFCGSVLVALAGCSQIPEQLDVSVAGLSLTDAQSESATIVGQRVRWGGVIHDVDNRPNDTLVTMIAKPLTNNARPRKTDDYSGRFILRIESFIDPVTLPEGRQLTAVGVIEPTMQRKIGAYDYSYPVIKVEHYVLWPESTAERETVVIVHDLGPGWIYPYRYSAPIYLAPNRVSNKATLETPPNGE